MRSTLIIYLIQVAIVSLVAASRSPQNQQPILHTNLGPAMPSPSETPPSANPVGSSTVMLPDVLAVSQRFEDRAQNSTILAPVNSAITALPRKPWEDAKQYDSMGTEAYEGPDGEERARKNMLRFVEAHILPISPWKEGERIKTLGGETVWWENKNGVKTIQPGDVEVSSIQGKVTNGEIWILMGVRNYL